ncbi:unnamed protein product [Peniophora sp. CBMAI 1063]|nr:unnamed protein product [Peniophora sp. CBMAI 1063]
MRLPLLPFFALGAFVRADQLVISYPKNTAVMYNSDNTSSSSTSTADASTFSGTAAYNLTELAVPALPSTMPALSFGVQLYEGGMTNLSIPLNGAFMGFSIEMSVSVQVMGHNSSAISVPFLNLMANLKERAGWVQIRVGGNSQEQAEWKGDSLSGYSAGTILGKDTTNVTNPTATPPLEYTDDLFVMLNSITDFANVRWYLGVPFYTVDPVDMDIVEVADKYLGDRVLAYQVGNEPDYYGYNGRDHRADGYAPVNYTADFGTFMTQLEANTSITRGGKSWLVPSISATVWNINDVLSTGLITSYIDDLYAMTVERYPDDNCAAVYGTGTAVDPNSVIWEYTSHQQVVDVLSYYEYSSAYAVAQNVPYIMFETNTASCSGFPGVSDAFMSALWAVDWSATLAYYNFSGALYHIGGQSAYYNAFTPPPTNQSSYKGWTVGPVYYAALVMAEALGPSNTSQIVDLFQNSYNTYTPGWAIYENGSPKKVLMINYLSDSTGASDYTASIAIGGGTTGTTSTTPSSVKVKYLTAPTITSKQNMTWAGQTLGDHLSSDGRLQGDLDVQTVTCDTTNLVCDITVPAPGLALVFLDDDSYNEVTPSSTLTFPTTYVTATVNTAQVDPSVLATSNGHANMGGRRDSTSPGSRSGAWSHRTAVPGMIAILAGMFLGVLLVAR